MIRFNCPTYRSTLEAPERKAGLKIACPRCQQRLRVPSPSRNQTVLGELMTGNPKSKPVTGVNPFVVCPGCGRMVTLQPHELGLTFKIECARCDKQFVVDHGVVQPQATEEEDSALLGLIATPGTPSIADLVGSALSSGQLKHSGLGIASFLFALVMGSLDLIMAIVIAGNIAQSGKYVDVASALKAKIVAGGIAMYCFNFMSLPACIAGAGLGFVGLVTQKERNHKLTWIGLLGNGVVIVAVVGLYLLAVMSSE